MFAGANPGANAVYNLGPPPHTVTASGADDLHTRVSMHDTTIVFDLDGTLVDTAPDLMGCIDRIMVAKGLRPVPHELLRPLISIGSKAMLTRALEHNGKTLPEDQFMDWWQEYLALYATHIADTSRPFPGLIGALDRLQAAGARLAVCTNKGEALSRKLLGELNLLDRFSALAGRDTFVRCYKPNPEHLLGTIRLAGGAPQRAVMIGDSDIDVAAGKNAAVPVIGVTFGYTPAPIASFGPAAVIDHYDELYGAIETIMAR